MKLARTLLLAGVMLFVCRSAIAQTTAFTDPVGLLSVQGVLHENGQPVNGFRWSFFDIFTAHTGGTLLVHDTNINQVLVSNGIANITYNIGNVVARGLQPTQEMYLQISLSPTGESGTFTTLSPRQRLVPSLLATLAVRAEEARRLIEPLSVELLPSSVARLDSSASFAAPVSFAGPVTFTASVGPPFAVGSMAKVIGLNADKLDGLDSSAFWQLLGNAGTTAGINFLGTTDDEPLELKVNNQRALRLEPTATSPNVIAGSAFNAINATAGASILGGSLNLIDQSAYSVVGGGSANQIQVSAAQSTIGGGANNLIGSGSERATIAGGHGNILTKPATAIGGGEFHSIASGHGTIGGGYRNAISEVADYSTVGGGNANLVNPNSVGATIGGGVSNKVDQAALHGTIAGGYSNTVGRSVGTIGGGQNNFVAAVLGTVAGGQANQVLLDAKGSAIGGGASNVVENTTTNATIAGGLGNVTHTNANFSSIGGGRENHIASGTPFATIPGGRQARAFNYGQVTHASGGFANVPGTAQQSLYVLRGSTTDTNSTELFLDGVGERMRVPAGSTWTYEVLVAARGDTAVSAGFRITGTMGYNNAGNLVMIGAPLIDPFGGNPGITAQVLADNVNKALTVVVRWGSLNATSARWVATARIAEVMF